MVVSIRKLERQARRGIGVECNDWLYVIFARYPVQCRLFIRNIAYSNILVCAISVQEAVSMRNLAFTIRANPTT